MADLDYALVIGRFGINVGDGADPNETPDTIWCDEGILRIAPLQSPTKVADGSPMPFTTGNAAIDTTFDADGHVTWNGKPRVWVVDLTSEKVNPRIADGDATHRITYIGVKANGVNVEFPPANVRLAADTMTPGIDPETGDPIMACDLTKLLPVQVGPGIAIVVGDQGVSVTGVVQDAPGEVAFELSDGTTTDPVTLPEGPPGGVNEVAGLQGDVTAPALFDELEPFVTAQTVAGITEPGPIADALSANFVRIHEFDLRSFLAPLEAFPDDNVLDAAPLINRAIAAIANMVDADTSDDMYELDLGEGRFALISDSIDMIGSRAFAKRIKIKGAGRARTVIYPHGSKSGFYSPGHGVDSTTPLDFFWYRNCEFSDFTINCRYQEWPEPLGLQKAFQGGGFYKCHWTRVNVVASTSTAFGADYPVGCTVTDCWAINAGRETASSSTAPQSNAQSKSGFGIGFGHYPDESITFIGGGAYNCPRSGYFFERQDSQGNLRRDATIRLIGVEATFCGNGISDVGACGVEVIDSKITDNNAAAIYNGYNTMAAQSGIYGRVKGCTIMRNGVSGVFFTGAFAPSPTTTPIGAAGGYVIEGNRIQSNGGPGVLGTNFQLEAGGLTVRHNHFIRNTGPGVVLEGATLPLRDLGIYGNVFDGNDDINSTAVATRYGNGLGMVLNVPMNAPRITDNDFINSDGVQRQARAIHFHPAEPITSPRVQRNTWRRHVAGLVNAGRLDATHITDNLAVDAVADPSTAGIFTQYFAASPDSSGSTLGSGWSASPAGANLTWLRTTSGARVSSGTDGQHALQVRDLGTSGRYVEVYLPSSGETNRLRGVVLEGSGADAIVAGVDDVTTAFGLSKFYSLWKIVAGVPTRLWSSSVARYKDAHTVGLARATGSTVTAVYIDGIAVHSQDIPDVASGTYGGVAAAAGADTARVINRFRALAAATVEVPTVAVRNMVTNPSFEVSGGFTSVKGVGGAGSASRVNDAPNAHSGTYSYLYTYSAATTDPAGAGCRVTAIELPTPGTTYTYSIFQKVSRASSYRALVWFYDGPNQTGNIIGNVNGSYMSLAADTWGRPYVTALTPTGTQSVRFDIASNSLAGGAANYQSGDTLRFDDAMVTEGKALYDYFDGVTNGGAWVGAANASASTKTVTL